MSAGADDIRNYYSLYGLYDAIIAGFGRLVG